MTLKELTVYLSEKEGKSKEVSVGNIREILGIISDLMFSEVTTGELKGSTFENLYKNGKRRAKKKT